jgi:acetyl esterase/lipase
LCGCTFNRIDRLGKSFLSTSDPLEGSVFNQSRPRRERCASQRRWDRFVFCCFDTASYTRFADGPWLTKRAVQWFWDAYLPDLGARKQATATPLNASLEELARLPEALVVVDENDVLRDEGEAYARKLSNAGVRVISIRYNGTIHDFVMLNALADTRTG